MLAGIQSGTGYEIMATANLFVINYSNSTEPWKVSKLVTAVRKQLCAVPDIEVILNLEEMTDLNESVIKSIWQISRMLNLQGITAKCVLPENLQIPALEAFAVNELVELFNSMDEIIYEGESQETWSNQTAAETFAY